MAAKIEPHENPGDTHGVCSGKDLVLSSCTCPDPVYTTSYRLSRPHLHWSTLKCHCCGCDVNDSSFGRSTG